MSGTNVFYDANVPVETDPSAVFYDVGVPNEAVTAEYLDSSIRLETLTTVSPTPVFYDVRIGLEWQRFHFSLHDIPVPSEWRGPLPVVQVGPTSGSNAGLPIYSAADYLAGLQHLLPQGPVWPRDADAVITQVLAALVNTYTRLAGRDEHLLNDAFPVAPLELLPEWELTLGLPDPCAGVLPTIQQRQQAVAARFLGGGGESIPFFIAYAKALGYTITITEFTPFRVGVSTVGQPINGEAWCFAWQVNGALSAAPEFFRAGQNVVGDPLEYGSVNILQCEFNRLKPAHTILIWN